MAHATTERWALARISRQVAAAGRDRRQQVAGCDVVVYHVTADMTRLALVVGLDGEIFPRIRSVLRQCGVAVERTDLARQAAAMMTDSPYDLVVCRYPLPDMVTSEFLHAKASGSG